MSPAVTPISLRARLDNLIAAGGLDLPFPGEGRTPERLVALYNIAAQDLSLARLAEAHCDALAILHEAGRQPHPGQYGVWASEGPASAPHGVKLHGTALHGVKGFCSGAGILDRALLTVPAADGALLIDVAVTPGPDLHIDTSAWTSPAFADTNTGTVTFNGLMVQPEDVIGDTNWYLTRPGFWHGALAPAACWAGGAAPLVDAVSAWAADHPDPHRQAHLGALYSARWRMEELLAAAAGAIDRHPAKSEHARRMALMCRHEVDRATGEILDRFGRAMGPRPYAHDAALSRRIEEVQLYRRQCHAERDLAELGRLTPPKAAFD